MNKLLMGKFFIEMSQSANQSEESFSYQSRSWPIKVTKSICNGNLFVPLLTLLISVDIML